MLKTRLIPTLLLRNGSLVKTKKFKSFNYIGDPANTLRIFNELEVDEIMILDISSSMKDSHQDFKMLEGNGRRMFYAIKLWWWNRHT